MKNHHFSLQSIIVNCLKDLDVPTSYLSEVTGRTPQAINKIKRMGGGTQVETLEAIIQSVSASYPEFCPIFIDRIHQSLGYQPPESADRSKIAMAAIRSSSFNEAFLYYKSISDRLMREDLL